MKKNRWVKQTLILSAALNVALIGVFFYFLILGNPLHFCFQPKEEVKVEKTPVNPSFLGRLQALSFDHLVELLSDRRMVEQGYRVCDFAAAALSTFYDFDVARALGKRCLPMRKWVFDETIFTLYPGLREEDFEQLAAFAKMEIYPFTTKGLLEKIAANEKDTQLLSYFCHTPEFILLERLFARTELQITKGTLLAMVREGGWKRFEEFYMSQEEKADFSENARRELLLGYVETGSKTAAYLLLVTDSEYALKQLEDSHVARMLDLLDVKTAEATHFVRQVVDSPRGDKVREQAFRRLAEYCGDEFAGRYVPRPSEGNLRPVFRESPPAAPAPSTHIVQPGESLWLIARKYSVPLELLMEVNHLQSTVIQPGKTLKIPQP